MLDLHVPRPACPGETLTLPSVTAAIAAKTLPLSCITAAVAVKTLPLLCISTAFVWLRLPALCVSTAVVWLKQCLLRCGPQDAGIPAGVFGVVTGDRDAGAQTRRPPNSIRGPGHKYVSGWQQQLVSQIGVPDHAHPSRFRSTAWKYADATTSLSLCFHCLFVGFQCFHYISLCFHCLSLPFLVFSLPFFDRPLPFHRVSLIFHCLSTAFPCVFTAFLWPSSAFQLRFLDYPLPYHCLSSIFHCCAGAALAADPAVMAISFTGSSATVSAHAATAVTLVLRSSSACSLLLESSACALLILPLADTGTQDFFSSSAFSHQLTIKFHHELRLLCLLRTFGLAPPSSFSISIVSNKHVLPQRQCYLTDPFFIAGLGDYQRHRRAGRRSVLQPNAPNKALA